MKVFVVAAVRNVAKHIVSTVTHIQEFCGADRVHRWMFVESDSTDQTLEVLANLSSRIPGFRFKSLGALIDSTQSRIQRIAIARQFALDEIRQEVGPDDIVIVVDSDGVTRGLRRNDLSRAIKLLCNFSVITANSSSRYYDILALRAQGWVDEDYRVARSRLLMEGRSFALAHFQTLIRKQKKIFGNNAIEVDSAFGGMAIYKGSAYVCSDYKIESGSECEHVHFHRIIREKGHRVCIDPRLRVKAERRHTLLANSFFRPIWLLLICLPTSLSNFLLKTAFAKETR